MSETLDQIKTVQESILNIEKLKNFEEDIKLLPFLSQSADEKYSKKISDLRFAYIEIQTNANQRQNLLKIESFHHSLCEYLTLYSRSIENEINIEYSNHFHDLINHKIENFNNNNKFTESIEIISKFYKPLKLIKSMQTNYEETKGHLNELSKDEFLRSTFSDKELAKNLFSQCDLKARYYINQDEEKGI